MPRYLRAVCGDTDWNKHVSLDDTPFVTIRATGHQSSEIGGSVGGGLKISPQKDHSATQEFTPRSSNYTLPVTRFLYTSSSCQTQTKSAIFPLHSGVSRLPFSYTLTAMLQSHSARQALQCLPRARRNLSSSSRLAALSPYNRTNTAAATQTTAKRNVSAKAPLQAAAAAASSATATRTVPSPAFNRDDSKLQPLQPYRQPEMDHTFVGKNGGEIFHEMMLRQGVKHVCKSSRAIRLDSKSR